MDWFDDEFCLRFAEGYDREDAAQRGESDPHADKGDGYAEWAAGRIACVRSGLGAAVLSEIKSNADKIALQKRSNPNDR